MTPHRVTEADLLREIDKFSFRQNLRRFTWQAWNLLPSMERPEILDLGCGDGVPSVELAILGKGRITAVDRDRAALARLRRKAAALDLAAHIRVMAGDIARVRAPRGAFDIVWSEGAVGAIGFEKALGLWRDFLKPGGHLVIHDEIKERERKLAAVASLGYSLVTHFIVPVDAWLTEYFRPLAQRLHELAQKYREQPGLLEVLQREEAEIEVFKSRPDDFASVFFILRKEGPRPPGRKLLE